jgi:hypothetical protein
VARRGSPTGSQLSLAFLTRRTRPCANF